jgi:hypothetical protein
VLTSGIETRKRQGASGWQLEDVHGTGDRVAVALFEAILIALGRCSSSYSGSRQHLDELPCRSASSRAAAARGGRSALASGLREHVAEDGATGGEPDE